MADTGVNITEGSGVVIDSRTEATNGNHRQVVVLGDPSTNAGVAAVDATNGLSVNVTNASLTVGSHAVTNAGTFVVQENGAALTSLQLIDDSVYTDGSGTVTKGIAVMGQDGTNPQAIKTDSSGELQVDVLTMPTVAVTQSGTWDEVGINDSGNVITVDGSGTAGSAASGVVTVQGVASMTPIQVGDNSSSLTIDYATTGSGTATGAIRVELPTNGTGVIATVGAVTAITNALPAGTNAIGKLAANSGVDIGDVDVTSVIPGSGATNLGKAEDGGHTTGDVGVMALGVRTDVPNAVGAGTTADYSFLATDMAGGIRTALYETDFAVLGTNHVKKYYTNAGAATDGIVWSPAAGKRWYVTDIFINVSAAATVTLEDDLSGGDSPVWKAELAANSGWSHHFGTPLFSGEDAADLIITTSAGNVYVMVTGYEI